MIGVGLKVNWEKMQNYLDSYFKKQSELIKKVNYDDLTAVTKLINQVKKNKKK